MHSLIDPSTLSPDEQSRGAAHHPSCPKCGRKDYVMRAVLRFGRGSAAGNGGALARRPKYWVCDDASHGQVGWQSS